MNKILSMIAAFVGNTSPKVKAALIWGALAMLAIALLNSITPADLAWAGPYEPVLFSAIPLAVAALMAWVKEDPLRTKGAAAIAAEAEAAAKAVASAIASAEAAAVPAVEPVSAPVAPQNDTAVIPAHSNDPVPPTTP